MAISMSIPTELSVTVVKILQENLRYFQEFILEPIPLTLICCPWVPCPPLEPEGGVSLTGTIEREWRWGLFQRKINVLLAEPESDGFWAGITEDLSQIFDWRPLKCISPSYFFMFWHLSPLASVEKTSSHLLIQAWVHAYSILLAPKRSWSSLGY